MRIGHKIFGLGLQSDKLVVLVMFLSICFSVSLFYSAQAADESTDESADVNQEEVDKIEGDIEKIKEDIKEEQKDIEKYSVDLQAVQGTLAQTRSQVLKTQSEVKAAEASIERIEQELKFIENRAVLQKDILAYYLRDLYYLNEEGVPELLLTGKSFLDIFQRADNIDLLSDKINLIYRELSDDKNQYEKEKVTLDEKKEEREDLLKLREDQYFSLKSQEATKQNLINKTEANISELQGKLNKLKGELGSLLGESIDTDDIYEAVQFASKATGVRKDFLMGMLVVESDLGRYTGGCTAKESRMSGSRLAIFKDICEELDYNWKKKKVSCPPASYSGTGGAMGVAQFMPDTWKGYKSSIASATGHNPPDPWSLADGVTAMALKLAKVSGVTSHKKSGECNAAKIYLSGTTSSKYDWYCDRVFYWANNWEDKV